MLRRQATRRAGEMANESLHRRGDQDRRRDRDDHAEANEVSHAGTRVGANPCLAMADTSDITSDIAMAMVAGIRTGAYLGSTRWAVALASPGGFGFMSVAAFAYGSCSS